MKSHLWDASVQSHIINQITNIWHTWAFKMEPKDAWNGTLLGEYKALHINQSLRRLLKDETCWWGRGTSQFFSIRRYKTYWRNFSWLKCIDMFNPPSFFSPFSEDRKSAKSQLIHIFRSFLIGHRNMQPLQYATGQCIVKLLFANEQTFLNITLLRNDSDLGTRLFHAWDKHSLTAFAFLT